MGVPVVTLMGNTRASRLTASVLTAVGLTDLIAETPAQYIEAASRWVGDLAQLAWRRGMRARTDAKLASLRWPFLHTQPGIGLRVALEPPAFGFMAMSTSEQLQRVHSMSNNERSPRI